MVLVFMYLEFKIRELFHLLMSTLLVITDVNNDSDVVTLADDQDLLDSCFVQQLNPLYLDVQVVNGCTKNQDLLHSSKHPFFLVEHLNHEAFLITLSQAIVDSAKKLLRIYAPFIDPKLLATDGLKITKVVSKVVSMIATKNMDTATDGNGGLSLWINIGVEVHLGDCSHHQDDAMKYVDPKELFLAMHAT
ncbi:hypothetical protein L7F22_002062 [Adiantum nelumboides]|nr:hypothetical protein [Adiantum nelumboides]